MRECHSGQRGEWPCASRGCAFPGMQTPSTWVHERTGRAPSGAKILCSQIYCICRHLVEITGRGTPDNANKGWLEARIAAVCGIRGCWSAPSSTKQLERLPRTRGWLVVVRAVKICLACLQSPQNSREICIADSAMTGRGPRLINCLVRRFARKRNCLSRIDSSKE